MQMHLLSKLKCVTCVLALVAGAAYGQVTSSNDWGLTDQTNNLTGSRHMGAVTLATGDDANEHPSLHMGCDREGQPVLFIFYGTSSVPDEDSAVVVSFLKHRKIDSLPIALWRRNDDLKSLMFPGDLEEFAKNAAEAFKLEVVVTSERGRDVYAYDLGGFGEAYRYLEDNCAKSD